MADTLIDSADGSYYRSLAVLTGEPERVQVLVEDEEDVSFWFDILSYVCPSRNFNVTPYAYHSECPEALSLVKGKDHILAKSKAGRFNAFYIGCVDSDYDYLLRECTEAGRVMTDSPYLLQTYAYSIENLLCYPATLKQLCCKATKSQTDFDIKDYARRVSVIVYPLLVWALFLKSKGYEDFTATKWDDVFPCERGIYDSPEAKEEILALLQEKVDTFISEIEVRHSEEMAEKTDFENRLLTKEAELPFGPEHAWLYVRGHDVYKFVLDVVLKPIHKRLKSEHIAQIEAAHATPKEVADLIRHYRKGTGDMEPLLMVNYEYKHSAPLYTWIKRDIEAIWNHG